MKITTSGWPGAGTSTLSILLCYSLDLKLIRGTETFRFLGKELNFNLTGSDRFKADEYLEKDFGPIYDKYIDYLILNNEKNNILIESDIASFRVGKRDNVLSIFLLTDDSERRARLVTDGRDEDVNVLKQREKTNRQFYKKLHNIDWFDVDLINEKHNLVIDNSKISIGEELKAIYEKLLDMDLLDDEKTNSLIQHADKLDDEYWNKGKNHFLDELRAKDKVADYDEVLIEIREKFANEVESLPMEVRETILKL